MKKTILFVSLIAALAACTSQSSETQTETTTTDSTEIVVDSTVVSDSTKVEVIVADTVKVEAEVK